MTTEELGGAFDHIFWQPLSILYSFHSFSWPTLLKISYFHKDVVVMRSVVGFERSLVHVLFIDCTPIELSSMFQQLVFHLVGSVADLGMEMLSCLMPLIEEPLGSAV